MADILKITTPLVNRTQSMEPKGDMALNSQFNLQEIAKVVKTNPQTEILKQNNGLVEREETSALLMNMLKDPTVAAATLKNIFAMQEMIKLLPVNNKPFTEEIEQLFDQLMVAPEDIGAELVRQEYDTCSFKGELFDFLRGELAGRPEQKDLQTAVLGFLKSLTLTVSKREILGSVSNSLEFLSRSIAPSRALSAALAQLAGEYRAEGSEERFPELKRETLELFSQLEDNLLYSPKLEKVVSMALYNLSRFNDNPHYLRETTSFLLSQLYGDAKRENLLQFLRTYLDSAYAAQQQREAALRERRGPVLREEALREPGEEVLREEALREPGEEVLREEALREPGEEVLREAALREPREAVPHGTGNGVVRKPDSVMDVLAKILNAQLESDEPLIVNSEKMEKIIHSLLSSPCNFTPLLHYVIPVQYQDTQVFAEIWINPHGNEDDRDRERRGADEDTVHMLLVFDVGGIGHFELELYVQQNTVDFSLLCPPAYVGAYREMERDLRRCIRDTAYQFGEIRFDRLERPRSLMDVFKSLPYKRTGVDVRV